MRACGPSYPTRLPQGNHRDCRPLPPHRTVATQPDATIWSSFSTSSASASGARQRSSWPRRPWP